MPEALSVLDPTTGEFLEHRQLRHDPRYKTTWDTSYINELGRLCQGIGSGTTPNSKQVACTNTFFIIDYHDIPLHKRKEICHTMVVCDVRPDKDDPDRTRITIGGNHICFPGDVGTNTASLELFKRCSTMCSLAKVCTSAPLTSRTFTSIPRCLTLSTSASKSRISPLSSLKNTSLQEQTAMVGSVAAKFEVTAYSKLAPGKISNL